MEQAEILTHAEFADRFIERITQFFRERSAYLSLLGRANPFSPRPCCPRGFTNRNRKCLSGQESFAFEGTVSTCCERLSPESPGHDDVYGEVDSKRKVLVVAEFKKVLTLYLGSVLSEGAVLAK
jgi:hypothetical protein